MCLTKVSKKTSFSKPINPRKWVSRYKLFSDATSQCVYGYLFSARYTRGRIYKAKDGELENYPTGFHTFASERSASRYAGSRHDSDNGTPILKVQVRGLLARGHQGRIPCEVYKYMRVPKA